jgi:hypothetical protein
MDPDPAHYRAVLAPSHRRECRRIAANTGIGVLMFRPRTSCGLIPKGARHSRAKGLDRPAVIGRPIASGTVAEWTAGGLLGSGW